MDRDTAIFVQFPHPGGEHYPPTDTMPWNLGRHRRKFLRSGGRLVDPDGRHRFAEVVFWGEWEAPSWIDRRWPAGGGLPRALHRPYWFRPAPDSPRQNTDPWVFGERMLYSNCRQPSPGRAPTSMQSLPPLREWLLSWVEHDGAPRAEMGSLPGVMWHLSDPWSRRHEPNLVPVHYDDLSPTWPGGCAGSPP
jgi:hypothetical protein